MAKNLDDSLIPRDVKFITYRKRFEKACERADIRHMHGHRHSYAHDRYFQLTGMQCPAKGGPEFKTMTSEQKMLVNKAKDIISRELGHSRRHITEVYL